MHALEHEIRSNPDAWEPWLVYADWLSERGDVRGRLISLEHHRARATIDADQQRRIQAEIDELIAAHEPAWQVAGMPEACRFEWRHGFIVGVSFPFTEPELEQLDALLRHPQAQLLTSLRLRAPRDIDEDADFDEEHEPTPMGESLLQALLGLELGRITALAIEYTSLGIDAAKLLADCDQLAHLRALDLRYTDLSDASVAALVGSPHLTGLTTLRLQRNWIGPPGARALAAAPHLDRLTILDLRDNPIGVAGAEALAGSANLRRLESLYLYRNDVGLPGARALSLSTYLPLHIRRYWAGQWSAGNDQPSTDP